MSRLSHSNFGLVIAYVVPGFLTLTAFSHLSPILQSWLMAAPNQAPTIGGFLYVTIAAVAVGLTLSTIRWLVLDHLHHRTGLPPPKWHFGRLEDHIAAFQLAVEQHYRYYQFYGNTWVALIFVSAVHWPGSNRSWGEHLAYALALLLLLALFFIASRDALRKYYDRAASLILPAS